MGGGEIRRGLVVRRGPDQSESEERDRFWISEIFTTETSPKSPGKSMLSLLLGGGRSLRDREMPAFLLPRLLEFSREDSAR